MPRMTTTAVILVIALACFWQGCDSGGNGPSGGGKGVAGGSAATYLAYLDPVASNLNVAGIATTGTLTTITGSPYLAGSQPVAMTTTPDGKFIYVVNSNSVNVSQFAIAADGTLTQPAPPVATGSLPTAIAIDPSERFALAVNSGASSLSMYSVNGTTGVLTPVGSTIPLNITGPRTIALNGNFVFVAGVNTLDVLLFNPTTSSFTFGVSGAVPASANIVSLLSPALSTVQLYALDSNSNSILTFAVSNNGTLTQTATVPTGSQPSAMVSDAGNHFLFVANQGGNSISVFAINATTGSLTPAATPTVTTEAAPNVLAFDPVNNLLFVSASGTKHIQAYLANSTTGALTPTGSAFVANNAPSAMVVAKP